MSIEAMKQALEALWMANTRQWPENKIGAAINALSAAIEQAEKQEPRCAVIVEVFAKDWRLDYMSLPVGKHRLYTQEYVYTTPPTAQRPPLTDEAIWRQYQALWPFHPAEEPRLAKDIVKFARAVEAAHGIKGAS